ncbi:Gtf2a2p [Cichlidogyrus casuarinus]|uniref:Gtf2a2p n=1 Tax=Cichlidogyrus casuarinus TaxID=1844966 RepID=A0ABD2QKK2_9PLAT
MSSYHQMYRRTSLGNSLNEALDDMMNHKLIDPVHIPKIFSKFDQCISDALSKRVKNRLNFKGKLNSYRCCDNVWTFVMNDVEIREASHLMTVTKMKIVACEGKTSRNQTSINKLPATSAIHVAAAPLDQSKVDEDYSGDDDIA